MHVTIVCVAENILGGISDSVKNVEQFPGGNPVIQLMNCMLPCRQALMDRDVPVEKQLL